MDIVGKELQLNGFKTFNFCVLVKHDFDVYSQKQIVLATVTTYIPACKDLLRCQSNEVNLFRGVVHNFCDKNISNSFIKAIFIGIYVISL